jgi:hypothetical protein
VPCLLKHLPAQPSAGKNRALNYRVILKNGRSDSEHSKHTHRRFARRQNHALANPTVASSVFKSRVLNPVHLNQVSKYNDNKFNSKEEDREVHGEENEHVEEKTVKSTENHLMKKNGYEDRYKDHHYHHRAQQKHYPHKRGSEPQLSQSIAQGIRTPDRGESGSDDVVISSQDIKSKVSLEESAPRITNNLLQFSKLKPIPSSTQHFIITKNKSTNTKPDVAARTKDLRLKGSDLYVARLGSCNATPCLETPPKSSRSISSTGPITETRAFFPIRRTLFSFSFHLDIYCCQAKDRACYPAGRDSRLAPLL